MKDVQNTEPEHEVALNRVGIKNFKLPISISQKDGGFQHTIANIDAFVDLDKNIKGISMSRIPIALEKYEGVTFNKGIMEYIADNIIYKSEAKLCQLIYQFPYFMKKIAPVTKEPSLIYYDIEFDLIKTAKTSEFTFKILVAATSCCPCSKEISEYGAHNQKCFITITCIPKKDKWVWIEDIIELAEQSASCEIYSILKRPDEKAVTERMYENAKFVEDITRDCYQKLISLDTLEKFIVEVASDESIHQHMAYSKIES